MKMEYIKLENFALISAGMRLNKIELDFSKTTNVINLIIGNNGTGKTALISNFHPFATLGHLENRDDSDLIIPGKNGKKTVVFKTKKHTYHIEHFYQWMGEEKSRKISSYIKKDGMELNSPGTVNGFLSIVMAEFEIDTNFLKLIRLGGNVTNFVELSSAGRIGFISKLLAAVEVYMRSNKKMRERANELNANLKAAILKKDRLNVSDTTIIQNDIERKKELLSLVRHSRDKHIQDFYEYQGSINVASFDTCETDLLDAKNNIRDLQIELANLKKPNMAHIGFGEDPSEVYNSAIDQLDQERMEYVKRIAKYSSDIESLTKEIDEIKHLMSGVKSKEDIRSMKEYIAELKEHIEGYKKSFSTEPPPITMSELTSDVDKINMIVFQIDNILNLNGATTDYFCKKYKEYNMDLNAIQEFSRDRLMVLHREIDSLRAKQDYTAKRTQPLVLFIPPDCNSFPKCPYYRAFNQEEESEEKTDLSSLESELECVQEMHAILQSFYSIKKVLSMRSSKITQYTINEESVLKVIKTGNKSLLVDYDAVQKLRDRIQYFDEYADNAYKLQNMETQLALQMSSTSDRTKEDLQQEIDEKTFAISEIKEKKDSEYEELEKINKKIQYWKDMISDYMVATKYQTESARLKFLISQEKEKYKKCSALYDAMQAYMGKKTEYENKLKEFDSKIELMEEDIKLDGMRIQTYNDLTKEIEEISSRFDYVTLLRDATSNSDGVPLVHIKLYCRALCTIANEIIKELYTGDFHLMDFNVKSSSFTIPYYTKGFTVKDIKNASQAEASVAKIAISFAILSQFVTKYNIILLDEIDGPMHRVNKERFFAALEGELDRLNCEQAFIITQSTMFNDYPVNLICTDPEYRGFIPKGAPVVFQR